MPKTFKPPPSRFEFLTRTPLRRTACLLLGVIGMVVVMWLLTTLTAAQNEGVAALPNGAVSGSITISAPTPGAFPAPDLAAQATERQNALHTGLIILGALDCGLVLTIALLALIELAYSFVRYNLEDNSGLFNNLTNPFNWAQRPMASLLNLSLWSLVAYEGYGKAEFPLIAVALIALQFTVLPLLAALVSTLGWELRHLRNRLHFGRSNV